MHAKSMLFILFTLAGIAGMLLAIRTIRAAEKEINVALRQAHAHNDYLHARPLHDALEHGFCSVEVDVFLVDGQLMVAHERSRIQPERTIESLYLEPLRERIKRNDGNVYPDGSSLHLLVDLKSDGPSTFRALHEVLKKYSEFLTVVKNGNATERAVWVTISGNRPHDMIAAAATRYASIDGRFSELDPNVPAKLMPLVSDNWKTHFQWDGSGPMPKEERRKLHRLVARAHAQGRRVRFWATPEKQIVWSELCDAGVDLINTDRLDELQSYLLSIRNTSN